MAGECKSGRGGITPCFPFDYGDIALRRGICLCISTKDPFSNSTGVQTGGLCFSSHLERFTSAVLAEFVFAHNVLIDPHLRRFIF